MKKKQNFTIDEKVINDFRKICDVQMIPMSNLIENFMYSYSKEHMHCDVIKFVENNYKDILKIALNSVKETKLKSLDLSTIVELDTKNRKLISKIILLSCYLNSTFKCGNANLVFLDHVFFNLIKEDLYNGMLGDMRVVFTNTNNSVMVCRNTFLPSELNINNIDDINQIINQTLDVETNYIQCVAFEYIL